MANKKKKKSLVIVIIVAAFLMLLMAGITYRSDKYLAGMFSCACQGLLVLGIFQLKNVKKLERTSKKLRRIIYAFLVIGMFMCATDGLFFEGDYLAKIGSFVICLSVNALVAHLGDAINDPNVK